MKSPEGPVHVRIGRLSVDSSALGGMRQADFMAELSEAIAARIRGDAAVSPHPLADRIADAISARLPASAIAGSAATGPSEAGGRHGQH
ncbi:hypothetical protein LB518_05105 [Mesorhizobium sp. BR1-1-16]|uniref:hypothetical protein n=1 Tax=Mesorhizobium sp. BR1-1-16 TaxID=2876653 RepID=UPI001CC9BB74|nr:hypothetical protein [Mesorhizobium sp. BR1-1-16]MBZ9935658.1 hypothetical protein [Mesorhizobium sp. BR1-1-16]